MSDHDASAQALVWAHALGHARTLTPNMIARAKELGVFASLATRHPQARQAHPQAAAWWRAHALGCMAREAESLRVLARLDDATPWIWLKGAPLARELYGHRHARSSGDLDLLIPRAALPDAARLMRELGYVPLYAPHPEPDRYHEWALTHPEHGMVVELHWSLTNPQRTPSPTFEALHAARRAHDLGPRAVWVLGAHHQLLGLACHFHHHTGFFKGLVDVAAWWDHHAHHTPDALDLAIAEAGALGTRGLLAWPLGALALLGAPVPTISDDPLHHLLSRATARWSRGALERTTPYAHTEPPTLKLGASLPVQHAWQALAALALDTWTGRARAWVSMRPRLRHVSPLTEQGRLL